MRTSTFCVVLALSMTTATAWCDSKPINLKQLEDKAAEVKSGKVAEYAPDALKEALASTSSAQVAAAGKDQNLARQIFEKATLLFDVAEAKAAERELLERVAVQRVELKKLEAQLERNLRGEEKP